MWGLITAIFKAVWGLFTGKSVSDAERLGQEETSNAQLKKGTEIIQKADDAAKNEEKKDANRPFDPDNRDDPRYRRL